MPGQRSSTTHRPSKTEKLIAVARDVRFNQTLPCSDGSILFDLPLFDDHRQWPKSNKDVKTSLFRSFVLKTTPRACGGPKFPNSITHG